MKPMALIRHGLHTFALSGPLHNPSTANFTPSDLQPEPRPQARNVIAVAIDSHYPGAFSTHDIALLERFAAAVSEGFQRFHVPTRQISDRHFYLTYTWTSFFSPKFQIGL